MRIPQCPTLVVLAVACSITFTQAMPAPVTESQSYQDHKSDAYAERSDAEMRDANSRTKYFHEPGSDDVLGHYDARYFKGAVDDTTRTDALHHLLRSYLLFFRENSLETWIAHGTLLGWWWNRQILPWDWDIDTQVSDSTLAYMAAYLNRTTYHYNSPATSSSHHVRREYLLDVNPWSWHRDHGDGMNVIDARWIDTRNGLYIDITGLSEIDPDGDPGIWSCKNEHRYRAKDLFPMRESVYEGVPVLVPYAYDKILLREYQVNSMVQTKYEGHEWNEQDRLWIRDPDPSEESLIDLIDSVLGGPE